MKANEEFINKRFIEIYDLDKELSPDVPDDNISIKKADVEDDIKALISYAVGCMFGRYTLEKPGIYFAGGEWENNTHIFTPDEDNIIPITDEEYFSDDIVGLFVKWVEIVFGDNNLEANLDYIAKALPNKGNSAREVIRNYFLNDFYKDHCNMYSVSGSGKRPIYWLFDSGKQNGFKCLVYLHRYNKDTVGLIRSDYLSKTQNVIENSMKNADYVISSTSSAVDRAQATKKRDKYIKQLNELKTYYQALSHVALQRIELDLNDGVKANYDKFQNIEILNESGKKQIINLLAKI